MNGWQESQDHKNDIAKDCDEAGYLLARARVMKSFVLRSWFIEPGSDIYQKSLGQQTGKASTPENEDQEGERELELDRVEDEIEVQEEEEEENKESVVG